MRSFKVEFDEKKTFVLDVQARNMAEAQKKVMAKANKGQYTLYDEIGDGEIVLRYAYDVTGTDDDAFKD